MIEKPSYTIKRAVTTPELKGLWDGPAWKHANILEVANFHHTSSDHHPITKVKLLYDEEAVYVIFRVHDRYVRCVHTNYQDPVCLDSCVEWFVQPKEEKGYFNFEINCGGTLHCSYIENPTILDGKPVEFDKKEEIPENIGKDISIFHSLPAKVDPEIKGPTIWTIEYGVPFNLFETYVGKMGNKANWRCKGNFFKCADRSSRPHFSSWSKWHSYNEPYFHNPQSFGVICFRNE